MTTYSTRLSLHKNTAKQAAVEDLQVFGSRFPLQFAFIAAGFTQTRVCRKDAHRKLS